MLQAQHVAKLMSSHLEEVSAQVVPDRPGLIIVKMDISFPMRLGEECVCQDPSGPIKGQIVTMPVPCEINDNVSPALLNLSEGQRCHIAPDFQSLLDGPSHLGFYKLPWESDNFVGEISLVPTSPGKDEAFLPVAPVLAIRQHREVRHTTTGWVPACCLLICTHGEALGRHTSAHQR